MLNPATGMFDYERAVINASAQIFLMRKLKGVSINLAKLYGDHSSFGTATTVSK